MNGFSGDYELKPTRWDGGLFGKQLYEFTNYDHDPLTYEDLKGDLMRPDRHREETDMGSVPKTVQWLLPKWFAKDRYLPAYLFHDDAYDNHGWWFAVKGGWEFRKLTRKQADDYLREMIISLGGSKANARAIWIGVRLGGWVSWGKSDSNTKAQL